MDVGDIYTHHLVARDGLLGVGRRHGAWWFGRLEGRRGREDEEDGGERREEEGEGGCGEEGGCTKEER